MVGRDVVVAHREECVWPVRPELGVSIDDRGPGAVDSTAVGKLELEPLSPGSLTVSGEETDPNAHSALRSGGTDRSRSSTSHSGS